MATEPAGSAVHIELDGRQVSARPGEALIAAAERAGTYIPRFCYHPRMEPVGVCRMCLVEVEGPRGATLQPACFQPVSDGMVVRTDTDKVKKAQDGVLEFLLANHPLDCPVCDKGGECPLQDQTLAYGPGESRFVEEKRHFEKPIPISELVLLDRERCIQCSRCTRFASEVAGEALIDFAGRGDAVEVATFPGEPFSSYFSGNTVQICPVGALTATPYRFVARPWDLEQVETTCTGCAVGCRVATQSSGNRLTRVLGVDGEVSHGWLCDKGRFGFEAVTGSNAHPDADPGRLTQPLVRRGGALVPASWTEALDAAADGLRAAGASVAALGGAQLTNEGAYAFAKLLKGVLGTDDVDAQLGDGLAPELVLGLPQATMEDLDAASCVLTIAGDLREELPVLFLRLRGLVVHGGTPLIELSEHPGALSASAQVVVPVRPGDHAAVVRALLGDDSQMVPLRNHPEGPAATAEVLTAATAAIPGDGDGLVVIVGRPSLAEDGAAVAAAARLLAEALPKARFLVALRRANVRGALELGLAPGLLPGRRTLEEGRGHFAGPWPQVPTQRGRDASAIVSALAGGAAGAPEALVLLGAEPLGDAVPSGLAERALQRASFVIALGGHHGAAMDHADVVLPLAIGAERRGTTTNFEGRVSRLEAAVDAPGQAWPDWMVAVGLADQLDVDLGFSSLEALQAELVALVEPFAGLTTAVFDQASGEGVVIPLGRESFELRQPLDPVAFPGVLASASSSNAAPVAAELPLMAPSNTLLSLVSTEVTPPAPDGYALRLIAPRRLYDLGTTTTASPSLRVLAAQATAAVNPYDLDRLGLESGDKVRLRTTDGQVVLAATVDPTVVRGTVVVPFNCAVGGEEPTNAVAALLSLGAPVVDVRMESR